jgi:phosphoglycolate phosphatase
VSGLRLIVFDVDGTLIDSQHLIVGAMRAAFAEAGAEAPDKDTILSIVGLSLPVAVAALAPDLPPSTRDSITEAYRLHFAARRAVDGGEATAPLYPGAQAALEALVDAEETLLGVATGKARRGLDHVFRMHAIGHYFVTAQTADLHPSKPHPSMLEAALAETGCRAEDAVMIGDTEFDVVMGRTAGFATVGVTWGYHPESRLRAAGADFIIHDYSGLAGALEALREVRR